MPLKHIRAAAFAFAAAAAAPVATPAEAGLRDSFENARDALGCTAKAVSNPMRVFESGMRNFERMTHKEFDRKANRSVKEALEECRAAAESIVARGFGVERVKNAADKARGLAAAAKDAAGKVAGWFGKDSAPDDRRRALAIGGGGRRFYEDAGVLGAKPLPKAKAPVPPADDAAGSPGGWDEAAAPTPDPWAADEDRTARAGVWDPPTEDRDPWSEAESAARDPFAHDLDADGDGGEASDEAEGGGYADALAALERRAEEARRQAEREAELARQQAEREAEMARQQAEREAQMARQREEAERQQAEREAQMARQREEAERQQAEREAQMARQREREEEAEYARRERENDRRRSGGSGLFGSGSGGGSGLFQADSSLQVLRDLQERNAREQERQQRENERRRQQWEEQQERQRQSANRQHQETERQRRQQQAQQERQRQLAERQRQQQEAERERERQRQETERRRREEERRQEAERRQRQQAANAATAAPCLRARHLKSGFNVADSELRNNCGYAIEVSGACVGTSFTANYPYKGTYSPRESMGRFTLYPGRWDSQPAADICHDKGRTVRWIACKVPFTPYFTSSGGGAYACFE